MHGWDAGSGSFAYDAAGRMLQAPAPTGLEAASYNRQGLPEAMALEGGKTLRYRYSASGQRTYKKLEGQGATHYVPDGSAALAVVTGGSLKHWKVTLPGGEVIGRVKADGSRRYYVKDHLGSIRAVLDGSGSVKEARDYYPFGLPMPGRYEKGSPPTEEDFTGHVKDGETGLHYAGARYYSAAFARWLKPDPILGQKGPKALLKQDARLLTMTSYNYAFDNPLRLADPTGMVPLDCPPCGVDDIGVGDTRQEMKAKVDMPEMKMSEEDFYARAADTYAKIFTALGAGSVGASVAGASGLYTVAQSLLQAATVADVVSTSARVADAMGTKKGTAEYARKWKKAEIQVTKTGLNAFGFVGTRFLRTNLITRTSAEVTGPLFIPNAEDHYADLPILKEHSGLLTAPFSHVQSPRDHRIDPAAQAPGSKGERRSNSAPLPDASPDENWGGQKSKRGRSPAGRPSQHGR